MSIETFKTTCAYCGVGCGVQASKSEANLIKVTGDQDHPANYGKLCVKGTALADTLANSARLLEPEVNGETVTWDHAIATVSNGFKSIIEEHGPDSVAFYVSGQLLTEDYYVANKLIKGYIGTANIDTNSRLCMSSSVAGHKRAFGTDTVPNNYMDLETADLIILTGSNTAWCHPVLYQRIKAAKAQRPHMKIVVIDPRKTDTCEIADLHLPIKAGSDVALFNGLLNYLNRQNKGDQNFIDQHLNGLDMALVCASEEATNVSSITGIAEERLEIFYQWFAETENTLTCYSQGVNQSSAGADKVNAILNCHLFTGRIGKPGCGPLSLTGQPNAMGGREVGGLANMLAAHMDFDDASLERVQRFWNSPTLAAKPGLKAVDLFDAVDEGKIKAIWIMATNPVVSLPNADKVKAALKKCDLVVVSDCMNETDTLDLAHVKLPATGWSEKDGTVTNSERRISRQRALVAPSGEARHDWKIICDVAKAMGYSGFDFSNQAEIFKEHAQLSGFENNGSRDFDISGLAHLMEQEYDDLQPIQWPVNDHWPEGRERFFSDGQFYTPSKKANLLAVRWRPPVNSPSNEFPFQLNTGRTRDQWHTMTRTVLASRLNQHKAEPWVEIHPKTADQLKIKANDFVKVESQWGQMIAKAQITDRVRPEQIYTPMHWTGKLSRSGRMGAVVNPATDPVSGQPESKHTPVKASLWLPAWQGVVFSKVPLPLPEIKYAVSVGTDSGYRYELAGEELPTNWTQWLNLYSDSQGFKCQQRQEYSEPGKGLLHWAGYTNGQLVFGIYVQTQLPDVDRDWLQTCLSNNALSDQDKSTLFAGKLPDGQTSPGPIVCACHSVGRNQIIQSIQEQGCHSAEEVGKYCKAGTNCGSCLPEVSRLVEQYGQEIETSH